METESSEDTKEKTGEKEVGENKSKEVALEPNVEEESLSPKETEGETKKEETNAESATESVGKETEEKVAARSEIAGKKPTEEKETVEVKPTQPEET